MVNTIVSDKASDYNQSKVRLVMNFSVCGLNIFPTLLLLNYDIISSLAESLTRVYKDTVRRIQCLRIYPYKPPYEN